MLFLALTAWAVAGGTELPEPSSPPAHEVVIWQGFRHYWERHALALFHMPHRVSVFQSVLGPESMDAGGRPAITFTFAQNTGVDGDFMHPEGYAARVSSPDLEVYTGVVQVGGVDQVLDPEHPRVFDRYGQVLTIPVAPSDVPRTVAPVLRGLSFRSRCADEPGKCNSDGIWPYRFRVELQPCQDQGTSLSCPVRVEIGRAWTPARGGPKLFSPKPLNTHMSMEIEVSWAVLVGPAATFQAHPFVFENALPSTRDTMMAAQVAPVRGLGPGLTAGTVGLNTLAFEFIPTNSSSAFKQRGRYIGGWSVEVGASRIDPEAGELDVAHAGGIWLPRTVHRTGVSMEVGMNLLLFRNPAAHVDESLVARGVLCANSHGAPSFSAWERCGTILPEGERTSQTVPLASEAR